MSWFGSSLGRSAELQFDAHPRTTSEQSQHHHHHYHQAHPQHSQYRRYWSRDHQYHVPTTQMHHELRLAPLQSPSYTRPSAVHRPISSYEQSAAERKGIAISDLLIGPKARVEHVPRTPGRLDVDLSELASAARSDTGHSPPYLHHFQQFTPVNRSSQYVGVTNVLPVRQHRPGGTLDHTLWTKPEPDARPSSRVSSNDEGPIHSRRDRSASSAQSPASSHGRSLDALSPLCSPATPDPSGKPFSTTKLPDYNFTLVFRQQPLAARACGLGDRDRRVIDPPPILELKITNKADDYPVEDHGVMYVLHCDLRDANGNPIPPLPQPVAEGSRPVTPMMGNHVASPFPAKDDRGIAGTFFVLPDLSCRYPGKYRLHFALLRIDCMDLSNGHTPVSTLSEPFAAYTAKDFPGMRESTPLLKALKRQGLTVGIKKGSEARKLKSRMRRTSALPDLEESDHDATRLSESPVSEGGMDDAWTTPGNKRKRVT